MAYLDNGVFNWPYDWNTILAYLFILCGKTGGKKRGEGPSLPMAEGKKK